MRVFKFGGASLRNAPGIRQVAKIVGQADRPLIVVVSAMGKTTNLLEKIHAGLRACTQVESLIAECRDYHQAIVADLFGADDKSVADEIASLINGFGADAKLPLPFDATYDQVVSKGEVISSLIVFHFLSKLGLDIQWLDARKLVATDSTFREGKVEWDETGRRINQAVRNSKAGVFITQGFIGGTEAGLTTTLGREGSDFTAAIFASALQATSVTIWKDVPGVMSADPKRLPDAIVFPELPFREAAEMTYYGASVIHPKTIKPLANKGIPLFVRNFDDPELPGTNIHECVVRHLPPLIVFKDNQVLISCKVTDYSFVNEHQMHLIFHILTELDIRVNVMQNSAISFSFCIDFRESKLIALIARLQEHFEVYYNTGLTLITVKNYDAETFERYRRLAGVILEQSSRSTLQILVKAHDME